MVLTRQRTWKNAGYNFFNSVLADDTIFCITYMLNKKQIQGCFKDYCPETKFAIFSWPLVLVNQMKINDFEQGHV